VLHTIAVEGAHDEPGVTIVALPPLAVLLVRYLHAFLGRTWPERAFVFVAQGREENRGRRGPGTIPDTPALHAAQEASAVRLTDGGAQKPAAESRREIATWTC
jgi:hypothetical protein